jgi:membrane protease subunit HflK
MAWNEPGKGKQDPWRGRTPGNGFDQITQRLRGFFGGGQGPLAWAVPILAVLVLFNSFKLIDERQRGVVLRFGAFNRVMSPGANFKWPWPIETATVIDATKVETLEDTVRVLTKDENIVDIKLNAQYVISDPRLYLFGFRDDVSGDGVRIQGLETLQNAAESAVREAVGNNTMDTVLFERDKLVSSASQHLQESLNRYHTGLTVTQFNLPDARPPDEVKSAFDQAISAREKKNSIINEAKAYASKIVPEARGTVARTVTEAEGYKLATIAKATGDAERFTLLVGQYRRAPEVTRKRLYLETMQDVMANSTRVVSGPNNVFYLPLNGAPTGAPAPAGSAAQSLAPLPAVRASAAPAAAPADDGSDGRPPRSDGREGGR